MRVTATQPDSSAGSPRTQIARIPRSHIDLIDGPYWAALTTIMPDGQPQTTPVWCNREGNDGYVLINTMRGFRKERNMRANPRVNLLVYDPRNPPRNIEARGIVVEMNEAGAVEHDDRLAQLYMGKADARFFGDAVPAEPATTYVPVKVTIAPMVVRVGDPVPSFAGSRASLRARSKRAAEECLGDMKVGSKAAMTNSCAVPVPSSHRDLLVRPVHGVLSTLTPDGQPQSSLVWVDFDGAHVLINTAIRRQKCRNCRPIRRLRSSSWTLTRRTVGSRCAAE